jgi:phosphoribosyl-ATP pyrophosphohydrolase
MINKPNSQPTELVLSRLANTIESRLFKHGGDPNMSYVAKLSSKGPDAALKKIGEEATELVMAAKDGQTDHIVAETADLWFHCLVVLAEHGLRPEQVLVELARREGMSGLDEKASRKL